MIKYKIVEVNEVENSIVVRYYTDLITEQDLAVDILDGAIRRCRTDYSIDLPIPAPSGAALDQFIRDRAPIEWFQKQELIKSSPGLIDLSHINSILNQSFDTDTQVQQVSLDLLADLKKQKLVDLAANRYKKEISGVDFAGYHFSTSRENAIILNSIYTAIKDSIVDNVPYKTSQGEFFILNSENVLNLITLVNQHVQMCFELEKTISESINSATTEQELSSISVVI